METRYYVFIHRPGPRWLSGQPVTAQPLADHFAYMEALEDQGKLILGGGFLDDAGALGVFECPSLEEARRLAEADPAVRMGVVKTEVHHYYVTVGGFTRKASS